MKSSHFAIGVFLYCFFIIRKCASECYYPTFKNHTSPPGHLRLTPLLGQRYVVENDDYKFNIGICTTAIDPSTLPINLDKNIGVLQEEKNGGRRRFNVGRINSAHIITGSEWLLLEYRNGQNYSSKCSKEKRKASIMFVCRKDVTDVHQPIIRILDEITEKHDECYYLFEIGHAAICPGVDASMFAKITSKLSIGSILILSFLVLITVYLIVGFFVQRSRGAKGLDQIPNYAMWQEVGNLIADGCDFVFRSRPKATNHLYPPMDDRRSRQTMQPDDSRLIDEDDNDDHLLPM